MVKIFASTFRSIKKPEPHIITALGSICSWEFLIREMKRKELYQRVAREKLYRTINIKLRRKAICESLRKRLGSIMKPEPDISSV